MKIYSFQWLSPVRDWRVIATYATRKSAIKAMLKAKERHNSRYEYRVVVLKRYEDQYFIEYTIDMYLLIKRYL